MTLVSAPLCRSLLLSRFFNWREALAVARPATMIRWHRAGWKLFWRLKSRPGRPPIPIENQTLIHRMAAENPSWGEEWIANELLPKLSDAIRLAQRSNFATSCTARVFPARQLSTKTMNFTGDSSVTIQSVKAPPRLSHSGRLTPQL